MLRNVLLLIFGFSFSVAMYGQEPGLRRPSIKYNQINTDTVRVIFPTGTEATAQRVAFLTTEMARRRPFTSGASLRKIDILLQNATDIPNGYVGLGPWRSEFYLTPPQSSFETGSLQWHDLLALHEFRHVQQLSSARTGISKWIYYLFGQEAYSGAVHLAVPNWFTEGDAVIAETMLSPQGRGRLPAFTNAYREMVLDGKYWTYAKARNGSLKEFIPSHYPLGFLLLNYGREKYGQQFWDSIAIEAAAYKGLFYSFSHALQTRTGLNTKEFYESAMDHYRSTWHGSSVSIESAKDKKYVFSDFSYPGFSNDGELYNVIEKFDRIPAIYKTENGSTDKITTPGFQTEPVFSIGGKKICWTELRRHPRWWREDFSVIVIYDQERNSKHTITHGSSYFMPALSTDGSKIVAVFDTGDVQQYVLRILSSETGEILKEFPNPQNLFYTYPQWSPDERYVITSARMSDGHMTLLSIDLSDGSIIEFIAPTYSPIGRPHVTDEWVYFAMTSGKNDQIFRVHRSAYYFEQLTSDPVSKYQPVIDPVTQELIYAQYCLDGKKLVRVNIDSLGIRQMRKGAPMLSNLFQESMESDVLSFAQEVSFPTSPYPLLTRPIRLHSWSLYADDPIYGLELLSENTLNTIQWRNGWQYNQNSGFHGPFSELTFGLWYPEIVAGYTGSRRDFADQNNQYMWWQHTVNAGLRIPFFGYSGPYAQFGSVSSRYNHISTSGDLDFQFNYLSHVLQFSNARKQALQDVDTRLSQSVVLRYLHSIDTSSANQFHVSTAFTVPSPVPTHVLRLEFDFRRELASNSLQFGDAFKYARGYNPIEGDRIWRFGLSYELPVVYPDAGLAGITYFRRLRVAPFFDIMRVDGIDYRSFGSEVLFDLNVFNVEPVSIGIRWSKLLDGDRGNVFDVILPVGF